MPRYALICPSLHRAYNIYHSERAESQLQDGKQTEIVLTMVSDYTGEVLCVMLIRFSAYIRVYWKSVKCALRVTESFDFGRKTEYIVEKRSKLQYNKGGPETTVSG